METSDRPTPIDLTDQFEQTPFAFDFFRAIRLLEARHPTSTRVGTSLDPREDPIRFGQTPSLAFAPSALEAFRRGQGGRPGKMLVRFFGLFGPNGPLPSHITEYAHERQLQAHDNTFVEFCNVFHHRLLSLFYRAWAVNQKSVDFDRAGQITEQSSRSENWSGPRFPLYIGSFFGLGMQSVRHRDEISDWAKLFYSGRLTCQTRNAEGLGAIVQDYFGMPTQIQTFMGQWLELPPPSICKMGDSPASGSLGVTTIVGLALLGLPIEISNPAWPDELFRIAASAPHRQIISTAQVLGHELRRGGIFLGHATRPQSRRSPRDFVRPGRLVRLDELVEERTFYTRRRRRGFESDGSLTSLFHG